MKDKLHTPGPVMFTKLRLLPLALLADTVSHAFGAELPSELSAC